LLGFQTRNRFEGLVGLNQKSIPKYESQANSPLGAHHFEVVWLYKEMGDFTFESGQKAIAKLLALPEPPQLPFSATMTPWQSAQLREQKRLD
jgi:hypothetical protein